MKTISLTQGFVTQVDDEDYEWLNKYRWFANRGVNTYYARRNHRLNKHKRITVRMHRLIFEFHYGPIADRLEIDHIDGNGLNNSKSNLRLCNSTGNNCNKGKMPNNKSGYKGVCWERDRCKWKAQISTNKKKIRLGNFNTREEAAIVYAEAAKKYHGVFAKV